MVEAEKNLMQKILGDVVFEDLSALFANGQTNQGTDYQMFFGFNGFGGASLGQGWKGDRFLRHGHFQRVFLEDFPEKSVSEYVDRRLLEARTGSKGYPEADDDEVDFKKEHLVKTANFYLVNGQIQDYLRGIKVSRKPGKIRHFQHHCFHTPEFYTGLVFADRKAEEIAQIKKKGATCFKEGGFKEFYRELVFERIDRTEGEHLKTWGFLPDVDAFGDKFFNSLRERAA